MRPERLGAVTLRLRADVKRNLRKAAEQEDRSPDKLADLLLRFGLRELERCGGWVALTRAHLWHDPMPPERVA